MYVHEAQFEDGDLAIEFLRSCVDRRHLLFRHYRRIRAGACIGGLLAAILLKLTFVLRHPVEGEIE
jgi:hypothetical protein